MARGNRASAQSVKQRLLNLRQREPYELTLIRFATERFLYRLSQSPHRDRFVLKGASLFAIWTGRPHRPTRDVDFLSFEAAEAEAIRSAFEAICETAVEADGVSFDPRSVRVEPIRDAQEYGGFRVRFEARLGQARIPLQADVGFGDVVTPAAVSVEYPTLLDHPPPRLRAYTRETVIAEKLQAMAALGMLNSRMKDFYDVWVMAETFSFDGPVLAEALRATFKRRRTALPGADFAPFRPEFRSDPDSAGRWKAFQRRLGIEQVLTFEEVLAKLNAFAEPPLTAARGDSQFEAQWPAGGPWITR